MNIKPTVISTFSGCGGSSLGYKWAGYKELLAIDFDKNSVEVFKLNFPEIPVWYKDIIKITGQEILEFCTLKKGELDLLDGSPPCQGFSIAGKRKVTDSRNDLSYEFIRLLKELQPKVFVMENVSGVIKGKMKGLFKEITKELINSGYKVKIKLMNTKYYGVPQSRQRVIWIGVRNDLKKEPSFPKPNQNIININKSLKGLKEIGETEKLIGPRIKYINKVKIGENMSKYVSNKYFNTLRLNPNKVSPTIPKLFGKNWGSFFAHWDSNRSISINELKRICSFPDDFKLIGKFEEQWARLGNAVMPKFMQAIAENIKDKILMV